MLVCLCTHAKITCTTGVPSTRTESEILTRYSASNESERILSSSKGDKISSAKRYTGEQEGETSTGQRFFHVLLVDLPGF